jgi:phosphoribosylformylglycinamidine synthase
MHILRGAAALSDFRLKKLTDKLLQRGCAPVHMHTEFVHFVDVDAALDDAQLEVLQRLLSYGPSAASQEPRGTLFLVVPRDGTISPWSSKATDIAHNCGLQQVLRVERGIAYYMEFAEPLSSARQAEVAALLHDRMVEQVLTELESAQQLFHHDQPAPMASVDVLGGGVDALAQAATRTTWS